LIELHFPAEPPAYIGASANPALFNYTNSNSSSPVTIYVPNPEAVKTYRDKWGEAKGNDSLQYGSGTYVGDRNHKAVSFAVEGN
jgi:hypothetical protein